MLLGSAIVALILIGGGAWYFLDVHRPAPVALNAPSQVAAAHLSIVVLPFTNLSGDASQDYFADGITENLTTDLSRIRNSFVIARNTAFAFKGKSIPVKEISKELGVRYVLEGSVQREGSRVRVNAQFIDGQTGTHLWADRFEEDMVDVLKLQDQVVARLANTLGFELVKAEAEKSSPAVDKQTTNLKFYSKARSPTRANTDFRATILWSLMLTWLGIHLGLVRNKHAILRSRTVCSYLRRLHNNTQSIPD